VLWARDRADFLKRWFFSHEMVPLGLGSDLMTMKAHVLLASNTTGYMMVGSQQTRSLWAQIG
jgi:hypothetical protein